MQIYKQIYCGHNNSFFATALTRSFTLIALWTILVEITAVTGHKFNRWVVSLRITNELCEERAVYEIDKQRLPLSSVSRRIWT